VKKESVVLFTFIILLLMFIFQPNTSLYNSLGIDGGWYSKIVTDSNYNADDYHIFKSFPSHIFKLGFSILDIEKNNFNVIFFFKILNLLSIIGFYKYTSELLKYYKINSEKFLLLFTLIFSFLLLKLPFYDVVTPDYFGLFLSAYIVYLHTCKNKLLLLLLLLLSFFTNPIVFLLGIVLLIFSNTSHQNLNRTKVSKIAFFFSCLFGMLILFWATYMIVPMHRAGIELTKWHIPDTLDIELFPVSALLISAFCAYFSYPLFQQSFHFLNFKNLLKVNLFWIVIFIAFMVLKSIVVNLNNSPTELDDFGHLLYIWPLYFCMKPLIGISEHIHSLGILIIFALLMWKDLVSECSKLFGLGGLIILGLFVLFIIKSEARHTLPFVPFVSLLVARVIPVSFFNRKNILIVFITSLTLSKFYYPLQLAEFSCDPQGFPAQHYFMFFGFSCNYTMYIFQIVISIFILFLFGKLISNYKLS
jgi:hypothetical protein